MCVAESPVTAREDLVLPEEVFVIPDGTRFLVYVPSTLAVASVNGAAVRWLREAERGRPVANAFPPDVVEALADAGILMGRELAAQKLSFPQKDEYDPAQLTLFLTTRCSLACSYCYASGGDRPRTMSWETAKVAIDWMVRHAEARGREELHLAFHGGGEVTLVGALLRQCVEYARAEAAARGMTLTAGAGLNGVMGGALLDWVLANIDHASVSLDGPPDLHDAQRPLVGGGASFGLVAATLRRMDEAGFNYSIRTTVTPAGLPRVAESVDLMTRSFKARTIQLEPMEPSGRAQENGIGFPDPHEFVRQFRLAREITSAHGRVLKYAGARFGMITPRFCQVGDDQLALTPDGHVTSCYEVGDPEDPRASTFFYGRLNTETHDLEIDETRLARLRTLTVEHKPSCDTCFCRWSCGGECAAKLARAGSAWETSGSPRCLINRELTLDQMKECLEHGGWPSPSPAEPRA
jgi:uncharacterized protein